MKKKMFVVAIAMMAMLSTLVGCGKTELKKNEEPNFSIENADENVKIEAETDSIVNDPVEEEPKTIDMTIEEYVRAVINDSNSVFDDMSTLNFVRESNELVFAVQDVNNGEYEYGNIYSIQIGNEACGNDEYDANVIDKLNVVDIRNCIGMDYYSADEGVSPYMTYNGGETIGSVSCVHGVGFNNAYSVALDESYGINYTDEGVSFDVKFEYDEKLDASVLKTSTGDIIAYFGRSDVIDMDGNKVITFTTELPEGKYVVYVWTALNNDENLNPLSVGGTEINFVTHR